MKKKAPENIIKNTRIYNIWWNRLANIIINSFRWDGLENSGNNRLTSRIIEMTLFKYGYGVFTRWENQLVFLPAAVSGDLNLYFEPTSFNLIGNAINIPRAQLEENSVLCRNVYNSTPTIQLVSYYAEQLADIQRAQDVNLFQSKLQLMIESDEDTLFSLKNAIAEVDANQLVLYAKRDIISAVKPIETRPAYMVDKYGEYKNEIFNEFLQTFGFMNIPIAKNERLTQSESLSSYEITYDGYAGAMLEMRKDACRQLKDILGVDITVDFNRSNSDEKIMKLGATEVYNENET